MPSFTLGTVDHSRTQWCGRDIKVWAMKRRVDWALSVAITPQTKAQAHFGVLSKWTPRAKSSPNRTVERSGTLLRNCRLKIQEILSHCAMLPVAWDRLNSTRKASWPLGARLPSKRDDFRWHERSRVLLRWRIADPARRCDPLADPGDHHVAGEA